MGRVLDKRILRQLKKNFLRYLILFALVAVSMYMIISMVSAAETVMLGSEKANAANAVEDGEFTTIVPLTGEEKKTLGDKGTEIEESASTDITLDDGSVLRAMKLREKINKIQTDEGRYPRADNELVLEKRYAYLHSLKTGDRITISGKEYTISGTGSVPDYDQPYKNIFDMVADSEHFGLIFLTESGYEGLTGQDTERVQEYTYFYRLGDESDRELRDRIKEIRFIPEALAAQTGSPGEGIGKLELFTESKDNPRINAAANDIKMNKTVGLFAGVVMLILLAYVISVFVGHQINADSGVIGSLYALGVKKNNMIRHYLKLPVIITLAAGIAGTVLGFSPVGMDVQMHSTYDYYSLPVFDKTYPVYLIIYGVVVPPLIAMAVNFLVLNKKMSGTALSLMRNAQKQKEGSRLKLSKMKFINKFRIRQMTRESKTAFTVVAGMFIALLILMLGVNCLVFCRHVEKENVEDTRYEYMYTLKKPLENVPEGAQECFARSLSKTDRGYTLGVTLLGIKDDNTYFDARPGKGVSNAVVGSGFATKYNVKEGDIFTLTDSAQDREYAFRVQGVADYSVGLTVFMNIESMRELFGQDTGFYNVLLSDKSLDIDSGSLFSTQTKKDVERASKIFISKMTGFFTIMIVLSVVIFGAVMFLMFNVMVDRASYGISLMKIFGYRNREVRKMYMYGNLYLVIASAIICVPLAKLLMDMAYPEMVANVTSGTFLSMPAVWYGVIIAGVAAVCMVIIGVLNGKLRKITPAVVLKNRD